MKLVFLAAGSVALAALFFGLLMRAQRRRGALEAKRSADEDILGDVALMGRIENRLLSPHASGFRQRLRTRFSRK